MLAGFSLFFGGLVVASIVVDHVLHYLRKRRAKRRLNHSSLHVLRGGKK